jgi:hypothetical protein
VWRICLKERLEEGYGLHFDNDEGHIWRSDLREDMDYISTTTKDTGLMG